MCIHVCACVYACVRACECVWRASLRLYACVRACVYACMCLRMCISLCTLTHHRMLSNDYTAKCEPDEGQRDGTNCLGASTGESLSPTDKQRSRVCSLWILGSESYHHHHHYYYLFIYMKFLFSQYFHPN